MDDGFYLEPTPTEIRFTQISWEAEEEGQEVQIPSPRANHSACVVDSYKVYVFGGNGGKNYENLVFKDLWLFNHMTNCWKEIKYNTCNYSFFNFLSNCLTRTEMWTHNVLLQRQNLLNLPCCKP